jgi:hypothetical protein
LWTPPTREADVRAGEWPWFGAGGEVGHIPVLQMMMILCVMSDPTKVWCYCELNQLEFVGVVFL